ncbi:MAG TPA: threonine--tRNA ligase [Patescibacteria group bacterium]|jgi:threonyl-tRNA synthetase|nr:threonine--tRNA ligase [Patescibacteria group bacterium]
MSTPDEKLHNIRHSLAHLLASAVLEMFPDAQLGVGPVIDTGFYYDFLLPRPLVLEDLPKLQKRMRELAKSKVAFERQELSFADATKFFEGKNQPFKIELIDNIEKFGTTKANEIDGSAPDANPAEQNPDGTVSLYKTGEFIDLCRGGHVENTAEIDPDSFVLDRISGAYWRGDQANPQMQRIYGLAFESKAELIAHIELREELEKRDHRILGPQLGMFMFHEYAPGIPFYLPKGTIVRNELEKFVREVSYGEGYSEVRLPQLFDSELFKTSGHWEHYKDDMFTLESENRVFGLKPMNCPGQMLMFKQGLYSYKDLPLRLAEMTTLYRNELSGTLSGLTRVRAFAQDDAHIFVTPDQIKDEVAALLSRVTAVYDVFGMKIEKVTVGTKPEQSLGSKEEWDPAEAALKAALDEAGWQYEIEEGDGAFYGPKIDMRIKDVLGREWQLATIQLDFQMPQRFGLEYVSNDGSRQTPIVIHRAILGSFERFMAILIEQYAGALPVWVAPVQATIVPVSEKQNEFAQKVLSEIKAAIPNARIELDVRSESMGKRIREASKQKVPYILVVGDKEIEAQAVAVRGRNDEDLGAIAIAEFIAKLQTEITERK